MQKLIQGIHRFRDTVFTPRLDFFRKLVEGQAPQALFITCSDSRVVPDLICQTEPGDLFVIRNAGNIIPPYVPGTSCGVAATVEYGLKALKIPHIVVCGHTNCGAMNAVLDPEVTAELPTVRQWLGYAQASASIVRTCYQHLSADKQRRVVVQENVLVQLEHLHTHPAVATALASGQVTLHAWVYKMETGEVYAYNSATGQFELLRRGYDVSTKRSHEAQPALLQGVRHACEEL
jgi:carbonic anhydrase